MNWIKKVLHISEKIKTVLKKRATKEEIANSDWASCCKGPILKKDLEKISGYAIYVTNIIELIVDKDLIFFLVKIIMKYCKHLFLKMIL